MVNKIFLISSFLLSLLLVPQNVRAQFSPGKKPKESGAVVYSRVQADTLQVRKSKLEQKKSRSAAVGKDSVKKVRSSAKKKAAKPAVSKRTTSKKAKIDSVRYSTVTYRLGDRIIMRGDSGADVRNVARILVRKLYMDEDSIIYTKSGDVLYDGELVKAVKRFQRLNGFYEDGIVSYGLIKALRKRK